MKKFFIIYLILLNFYLFLAAYEIEEIWSVANLDVPESAVFYKDDILFVSNINGDPSEKDKNGYIAKVDFNGKIIDKKWIATLDAPKGMAIYNDNLYVADIDQLVIISIKKSEIIKRVKINGAIFLNDVASDSYGNIYISDSSSIPGKIYKYDGKSVETWLVSSKIKRPNGLYCETDTLLVGSFANGMLFKVNLLNKTVYPIEKHIDAIDGITKINQNTFILSNWFNSVVIVKNGITVQKTKFLFNCADIFYVKKADILLIPTFFNNSLKAFKIK